jgi:hypothetical protein
MKSPSKPSLAQTQKGSRGEDRSLDLPLGDLAAQKEKRRRGLDAQAAKWFDSAVGAYGKAQALALELDVTESYLSDMRAGDRSTPLRALLPLLKSRDAVLAFVAPLCDAVGLAEPQPKRTVSREEVDAKTAQLVRRTVTLWKLLRSEVAAELGADEEQVDLAIEAEAVAK